MVLHFYGIDIAYEDIDRFVLNDDHGGTMLTELGRFALSQGLTADCLAFNLYFTHPDDARLSSAKLVRRLIKELGQLKDPWYEPALESTIYAIEAGLRYRIQKPNLKDVTRYLEAGAPAILAVNYSALHDLRGDPFEGHDIVITGVDKETFFFIDPRYGEEETITGSDLHFAFLQRKIIAAAAYLLAIKRTTR